MIYTNPNGLFIVGIVLTLVDEIDPIIPGDILM